jgi:hypothetical protein
MRRGHPNKNPGTMRSTPEPRRRRDSGRPAGDSIQAKGCPMAHTAAKRVSESPTTPPPAILSMSDRRSSLGSTHLATEAAMAARINARLAASVVVELKISGPVKATPNRLLCLHTTSQLRCLRLLKTTKTNSFGRSAGSPSSSKAPDDERLRIIHLIPSPGPNLILPAFNARSRPALLRSSIASASR